MSEPTELQVQAGAVILATTPLIDAPKLGHNEWMGLSRQILEAAELAKSARSESVHNVPEGCTPTDAAVLREANAILAEENHNLRRCLRFYANGDHYTGLLNWEGPSGDDNWLCPPSDDFGNYRQKFIEKMDEAMVEDGSVAHATLISGKFNVESPEDEPKVVKGEPEWQIEQQAAKESK